MMRRGSVGTVTWPGVYGPWWQADPKERSVMIFLAHNMIDLAQVARGIGLDVWTASRIPGRSYGIGQKTPTAL